MLQELPFMAKDGSPAGLQLFDAANRAQWMRRAPHLPASTFTRLLAAIKKHDRCAKKRVLKDEGMPWGR